MISGIMIVSVSRLELCLLIICRPGFVILRCVVNCCHMHSVAEMSRRDVVDYISNDFGTHAVLPLPPLVHCCVFSTLILIQI